MAAPPTASGMPLIRACISMPRIGRWQADVEISDLRGLSFDPGAVTVIIDGVTFVGTVIRGGPIGGRWKAKLVGGAGGLARNLDAKNYANGVTIRTVVADIMAETGEALTTASEHLSALSAALDATMDRWERTAGAASASLAAVLAKTGSTWRILADGSVWCGADSYPTATVEHVLLDEDWAAGITDIAPTAPDLTPGVTFLGHRLEYVVHRLEPGGLRTEAYVTAPGGSFDRFLAGIRTQIDLSRLYAARVVSQNADGTLQVFPDDAAVRGLGGLDRVSIRSGVPGSITVPAGARCRIGFEGGSPSKPFAMGWDGDELEELRLGNADDHVALGPAVESQFDDLKSAINGWTPVANDGGAALKLALTSWLASSSAVSASKVKAE